MTIGVARARGGMARARDEAAKRAATVAPGANGARAAQGGRPGRGGPDIRQWATSGVSSEKQKKNDGQSLSPFRQRGAYERFGDQVHVRDDASVVPSRPRRGRPAGTSRPVWPGAAVGSASTCPPADRRFGSVSRGWVSLVAALAAEAFSGRADGRRTPGRDPAEPDADRPDALSGSVMSLSLALEARTDGASGARRNPPKLCDPPSVPERLRMMTV